MLDGLLDFILTIFFWIASLISSLIFVPVMAVFQAIFPNFDSYLDITITFWNRILDGVVFAKEVFLNVTGFPRSFLNIIITYWFAKLSIMATKRAFKFLVNMYMLIRGNGLEGLKSK